MCGLLLLTFIELLDIEATHLGLLEVLAGQSAYSSGMGSHDSRVLVKA